jgi:hypothetical protein
VGYQDELNLYIYTRGDPIDSVDPTGTLISGVFDPKTQLLWLRDNDSGRMDVARARSGGDRGDWHTLFAVGLAIDPGKYDVLTGPHQNDAIGMYRLEPVDSTYGDDKDDAGRSGFRIHGGTRTAGCVLICSMNDAKRIIDMINSTSKANARVLNNNSDPSKGTHSVTKYGTLSVLGGNAKLSYDPKTKTISITTTSTGTRIPHTQKICTVQGDGSCT